MMSQKKQDDILPRKNLNETLGSIEFYIIKVVLIVSTAIAGLGFLIYAAIHVWKFLGAALH